MEQPLNKQSYLPEEEGIDIKKYIFLILNHWWWFAISVFVALTIAYLVNRYSQKIYQANCSLIIGDQGSQAGSIENMLDELSRVRNTKRKAIVENEISVLKSYKMARLALEELDFGITYTAVGRRGIAESQLYKQCPFIVLRDTSKPNLSGYPVNITILSNDKFRITIDEIYDINRELRFGEKFTSANFNFTLLLRDPATFNSGALASARYYFVFNSVNAQANQYRSALNVEVNDEKGSILTLSMKGFVREQVSDYLNKLSEVYVRSNLQEKNQASVNTIRFIDEQLRGIVDSLESTGLRLQQFRASNKVIDLSKEGSFLFTQMESLQSDKAILDLKSRYYDYLLQYINNRAEEGDVVAPSVVGIQDNLLNGLVSKLNELNMQKRSLSFSVQENSPQSLLINNQVDNTRKALQENLGSLIESNRISLRELNVRISKIDTEVQKLPVTERQMINIQRNFNINDQIYTFLLEKRAEAGISKASNISDHKILDTARPENAAMIKPNISLNYLIALVLGGAIPLSLLLLLEFFNTKITDRKYLENNLRAPIIGDIGHKEGTTEIPVTENPKSSLAESFRALRTNLQYMLTGPGAKVIAVSSAVSGEGKTFCAVNLACIFAITGKKTLLISLDLRRPKIHRIFNLDNTNGISTYLIGKVTQEEIIQGTNINYLYIANSGPMPPNPAELMGSEKMKEFIAHCRKNFDYILIDTPPAAIVTDAIALKDSIDVFVFVIRHNFTSNHVVQFINELYEKQTFRHIGVVVNDIVIRGYYGYSYRYGYGYGYGYSAQYSQYEDYVEKKPKGNLFTEIRRIFGMKG
jgi:capsular exopolysaccharide synthesis family protein